MSKAISINENEVVKAYYKNRSSIITASSFGVSAGKIQSILRKKGIKLAFNNKYEVDKSYFRTINSHEKAYLLGLLFADGCIRKFNGTRLCYTVKLKLHKKDIEILRQMKIAIKSNAPIKNEKHTNCKSVSIYCKDMVEDLISHGCVQTKSLILKFPKHIKEKYWGSFILGYFDGDGSICKGKRGSFFCSFVGTYNFLSYLNSYFEKKLGVKPRKIQRTQGKVCSLCITGIENILKIKGLFYKRSTIYLKRKRKIFDNIIYRSKDEIYKDVSNSIKRHTFLQYDKQGRLLKRWESMYDILMVNKKWSKYRVYRCCMRERKDAYGFVWKYGS